MTFAIAQELPPQLDDIRKIEVEPMETAIVEFLEARAESGADLDYRSRGMLMQELRNPFIEHGCSQCTGDHPRPLIEPLEVPVDVFHDIRGPAIFQNGVLPTAFDRSQKQRNQHRLLGWAEPDGLFQRHEVFRSA